MTDLPERAPDDDGVRADGSDAGAAEAGTSRGPRRRRGSRRAHRPATNPGADDAPDVREPRDGPSAADTPHDRWLREQRPPHWE
ncbi:hypothetical protein KC207_16190 [Phycicoccus sp. BSK3Z-2]|uniref:Uncharacterized protein n=1 Tax=Phycicoccus avicenniae TaxID=2828860 RepID=A0A941DB20_9MICO|nr:hypothetical protein [Phycicoccus avicenniae]MBR7744836.1 hypothetical protein [Phycicoccus avicenniae]